MNVWSLSEIQTNHIIDSQPKKMLEWGSGEASQKFVQA